MAVWGLLSGKMWFLGMSVFMAWGPSRVLGVRQLDAAPRVEE